MRVAERFATFRYYCLMPVYARLGLTLTFRIGENKLRKIVSENKDADFILWNGTRPQIKRVKFERFVGQLNLI